ncbi:MAG: alpha-amylase family glycosyl hydrolase [Chthoniobacterales bacterium]
MRKISSPWLKTPILNRFLALALSAAVLIGTASALPQNPELSLDPTYGLFPRGESHRYFPSPQDWRDVNIYQLFTDRFADGDPSNNTTGAMGINRSGWFESGKSSPQNRNFHHGGDWKGLKDNLDYLTGMGVNAIWISGVQMNAQGKDLRYTPYHMYHPTDFFNVDPVMGTFQDLTDLIDACHARGVYVILDVVINHTADLNGLWGNNQEDDKRYWPNGNGTFGWWDNNRKHPFPFDELRWFHNNGTINSWDAFPETLRGQFKGTDDLATDSGHVTYWITEAFKNLIDATDCDGFRVDAIKHVEYNWVKKWADDIRKHAETKGKNDFILFGELFVYDNNALASYCREEGFSFNSALFFPMSQTIKRVFVDGQGTGQLTQALNAKTQYGEGENRLVTFIDNHDVDRIGLYISGSGDAGRINYVMRPALTFLYTATPVPCLYYGTEHAFNQGGHANGSGRTAENPDDGDWQRETMFNRGFQPGPAAGNKLVQTDAPQYLHIKALNQARKSYPALTRGSFTERWQNGSAGAYAYSRVLLEQEALVALNTAEGNVTINPMVGKPNGTEFTNVLNPSEKITVTNGRLSFSLSGKDSKIFVAGALSKAPEARATSNATEVTISYVPHDGPLKAAVGTIQVGLRIDGGAEQFVDMTAGANGVWTYTRPFAGITTTLAVTFRDSSSIPVVDATGGAAWTFDATQFGRSLIVWSGNTVTFPPPGEITASADLWIDTEVWPQNVATGGKVSFTTDDGVTWRDVPLAKDGTIGNNEKWHANLGRFPGGSTVKFIIELVDTNGVTRLDNDALYTRSVQFGTVRADWVGDVSHWPLDGEIEAGDDFWVDIESYPQGAGIGGEVRYSIDGGENWRSKPLALAGTKGQNDLWHANLGSFPSGTPIQFAVMVQDTTNVQNWDNNGGGNYRTAVNGILSTVAAFDNVASSGVIVPKPPQVALEMNPDGSIGLRAEDRNAANTYKVLQSEDLEQWSVLRTIPAGDEQAVWDILESASTGGPGRPLKQFYKVEAVGGTTAQVYAGGQARISIRTVPPGGAQAARLIYSLDGGETWGPAAEMAAAAGELGDIWSVEIPGELSGDNRIKFAIELIDQQGRSLWANNNNSDYLVNVLRPGQTDFEAPVASHSPANTTTSAASLQVTLAATDNNDPAPRIFYTLDDSDPTTASPMYSLALQITQSSTLRYFAVDAQGNASGVSTVEVRVGQRQNFGPDKPYSTNPTLGQAVPNGSIVIDGANTANEWTDDKLIALGMANDDPRSLGSNWTMHEAPINLTHMWAAWDDTHLYLAWQYVDVTDVIDPSNAGGAGGSRIGSNDGILQWIALDTDPATGAAKDVWRKNQGEDLWNGANKPNYQIYLAGSLWQGFVSRAVNGVFALDDGGTNYFTIAAANITAGKGATFTGTSLWGVGDADDRRVANAPNRNFLSEGHNTARDSFYEIKIPLEFLGVTRAQLENQGIGVMIGAGSNSLVDVLPQDDGATLDTQGVEAWNSPLEWGDIDSITVPFARIGAW